MSLFKELKWRNLIKECNNEKKLETLLEQEMINFYCGFDPTAPSLTIGHLVQIITILLLSKNKHVPFILIGGATGLIGDPKEDAIERTLLSHDVILYNVNKLQQQFQKLLPQTNINFVNNYEWISQLNLINFFRDYGKLFNVNYMIRKDKVAKRLEKKGISYTEFSYMIFQALDFYQLYKKYNVKLQFGGSDQWGNITSGLELISKIEKISTKNEVIGMSIPLLLDRQGNKFGKSEKQTLWLDPQLTRPYEMYQYLFNTSDIDVINYLKSLTLLEIEKIKFLQKEQQRQSQAREAQKALADFVIVFLYGATILQECQQVNTILFHKKPSQMTPEDFFLLTKHLHSICISQPICITDALKNTKLATSKNEARRLITAQSIKIGTKKINQIDFCLTPEQAFFQQYILLTKKNKIHALLCFQ
ncbi:tyrosine--tRNA ligase [Candidatus Phytoplasma phoenicium]|uniref:Tyrosine--tRNA ligase n=1 Tax=Candidatus Phytoplasma phoenicium TaxID=198422 RepID=A0A0L0MK87_9MOLU|nr:tyrosine--tRNA ligase [Candidatus Phytoplasma phoenicium]KND62705.1 Tyrosyl-tRNA synthetase [Candidatus Phytoplasma phoenicium]